MHEDEIEIYLAESGADREPDFDREQYTEDKYAQYVDDVGYIMGRLNVSNT